MARDTFVETIENSRVRLSFDRRTGTLVSLQNRVTGNQYLQDGAAQANVFAVYYDFTEEFAITGSEGESPHRAAMPAAITER